MLNPRMRTGFVATAGVAAAIAIGAAALHGGSSEHRAGAAAALPRAATAAGSGFTPRQPLTAADVQHATHAAMLVITHRRTSHRPTGSNGKPSWPAGVSRVLAMRDGHADALKYVGSAPSTRGPADNRNVLVVRALGHFSTPITGPPGSSHVARGTVLTLVVDPISGAVYDFDLEPSVRTAPALSNPTIIP